MALALGAGLLVADAPKPAREKPRVVLVFLDGAADWLVDDYLARGVLPADGALAGMARTGVRAEAMIPPDASVTAPAHYTMLTGAWPEQHGIVNNTFHTAGDPISRSTDGFEAPIRAETLWQAARRQGKRVISVAAFADATTPERSADRTLAYGSEAGQASVVKLLWQPAQGWKLGSEKIEHARELAAAADSPGPLAFRLDGGECVPLYVLAVDTRFDDAESYDTVVLDFDRDLTNGVAARLAPGAWAPVALPRGPEAVTTGRMGAWVKLLELAGDLSRARLYLGAPYYNRGAPKEFVAAIETELGFWPGEPDDSSLNRGLIDEATWREQAERVSSYIREAALWSLRHYDFDLLITYQPLVDHVEHRFLLRDPRQPGYADENGAKRARYEGYVREAYRAADQTVKQLMEAAPPGANFVVASDHGMVPIHSQVAVNALLAQAGFRVAPDDTAEVRAYTTGSTGHIYLNLAGREPGGVVPKEKYGEYVERIAVACRALRDPATPQLRSGQAGEAVFDRVLKKSELGAVHLGHPLTAGDVWVNARPGYRLVGRVEPLGAVLEPSATERGTHGYTGDHWETQAIFFAAGPGVAPGSLGSVRSLDVAATVSALLGIRPPAQNQGRNALAPAR